MDEEKLIEELAAEIRQATADGDHDRARKLADLQRRIVARTSSEAVGGPAAGSLADPVPGRDQLARIARRISTEALAAELAAERGDWETVHATYQRLAILFAEYRLAYEQSLRPRGLTDPGSSRV